MPLAGGGNSKVYIAFKTQLTTSGSGISEPLSATLLTSWRRFQIVANDTIAIAPGNDPGASLTIAGRDRQSLAGSLEQHLRETGARCGFECLREGLVGRIRRYPHAQYRGTITYPAQPRLQLFALVPRSRHPDSVAFHPHLHGARQRIGRS
jgi:hypothetical protein